MSPSPPTWTEQVVTFGPTRELFAIDTLPTAPKAVPAVLILNAGILHRVGPNRLHVELARRVAARGHRAFRFDLAGIGDSPARRDGRELGEGVKADIDAAITCLKNPAGVVVFGLCAGADNALRAAARHPQVVGAVLLDPTVFRTPGWYVRRARLRARDPESWRRLARLARAGVSRALERLKPPAGDACATGPAREEGRPEFFYTGFSTVHEVEAHLIAALARDVQLYYAFTGGWSEIYNYETQLRDNHPKVDFGHRLRLRWNPDADHTYTARPLRDALLRDLDEWLARAAFTSPRH
jgi:pimeloyl-ACP methyl ester carboxylesterase